MFPFSECLNPLGKCPSDMVNLENLRHHPCMVLSDFLQHIWCSLVVSWLLSCNYQMPIRINLFPWCLLISVFLLRLPSCLLCLFVLSLSFIATFSSLPDLGDKMHFFSFLSNLLSIWVSLFYSTSWKLHV